MTVLTTICVLGFPTDAQPRELKNFCRFQAGFEGCHVAFAGNGCAVASAFFVKFETHELAGAALDLLNGLPYDLDAPAATLKAEWAKRELEIRSSPLPLRPKLPFAARAAFPLASSGCFGGYGVMGPAAFPLAGRACAAPPEEIVTLAVLNVANKGFQTAELQQWFALQPGFEKAELNDRISGVFVRFNSRAAAETAMQAGNQLSFGVEWARRNLDNDLSLLRPQVAAPAFFEAHAQPFGPQCGAPAFASGFGTPNVFGATPAVSFANNPAVSYANNPAVSSTNKRVRVSTVGEIDTIAIVGLKEKGISSEELQTFFRDRPGFLVLQANDRIGSLFVKFGNRAFAEQAINECAGMQIRAEWARRNLDN